MEFEISLALTPPTAGFRPEFPKMMCDFSACETLLQVGFFFDGTLNNLGTDRHSGSHTNIARLYRAYSEDLPKHIRAFYVPGVGTAFDQLAIPPEETFGASLGVGCETRMHYACAMLFNALYRTLRSADLYPITNPDLMQTVCSELKAGYIHQAQISVESAAKASRVKIKECVIDVFGFSRGAATARAFCNRIARSCNAERLFGIPITFRFVGLFDTVASSGLIGFHNGWAAPENLRVPDCVRNCVHMVAAHELRSNFPVDLIHRRQARWVEVVYPGSHSDVGGGYAPGELGVPQASKTEEGGSLQLAQIPLNHMYACAQAAGVPLNKSKVQDDFVINNKLLRDYQNFVNRFGAAPRKLQEWLGDYLAWRWQSRNVYPSSRQFQAASGRDREIMLEHHRWFVDDAELLMERGWGKELLQRLYSPGYNTRRIIGNFCFSDEAKTVFARVTGIKPLPPSIANFFDCYVHDSLAGFNRRPLEREGYWRYRRAFRGTDEQILATNTVTEAATMA